MRSFCQTSSLLRSMVQLRLVHIGSVTRLDKLKGKVVYVSSKFGPSVTNVACLTALLFLGDLGQCSKVAGREGFQF